MKLDLINLVNSENLTNLYIVSHCNGAINYPRHYNETLVNRDAKIASLWVLVRFSDRMSG